jgi:hypothetical protein
MVINRTWTVTESLAARVNETAKNLGLYPSDLVRFLLTVGLDNLDVGALEIPTVPRGAPFRVDWGRVDRPKG